MLTLLSRHQALALEFTRFGAVGAVGYAVDTAIVYALLGLLGPGPAGMPSFLISATVTWALNRAWTWRGRSRGSRLRQWAHFLAVSSPALLLNRGVYEALVYLVPTCAAYPFLATAAGTGAGMFVNFVLSRRLVFR
jgi:putative flippase GtrA